MSEPAFQVSSTPGAGGGDGDVGLRERLRQIADLNFHVRWEREEPGVVTTTMEVPAPDDLPIKLDPVRRSERADS